MYHGVSVGEVIALENLIKKTKEVFKDFNVNTNTISDATKVFAKHFERAGNNEMNMNKRIKFAYQT